MKFHVFFLLCVSCFLFASSCEEVVNAGGVQILVFKHKEVPDTLDLSLIRGMILDETPSFRDGTVLWGKGPNVDPNLFNDATIKPAPGNTRVLQIRANNSLANEQGLTGVQFTITGDLVPGNTYTSGTANLFFGQGQEAAFATDAAPPSQTYFEFTITDLDEVEKRIKAEFHFMTDNVLDPADYDRVVVMDGSLNMSYTE